VKIPLSFLLRTCLIFAAPGWAADSISLRVAAQSDSEPKFVALGNSVGGNCIDIFRAIEKADPGIKFVGDQRWMPLKRMEAMVSAGQLDAICGLIRNKERIVAYKIPNVPLFTVHYHLMVRADDPVNVNNFDEIRKLKDGVILVNGGSGAVTALTKAGNLKIDQAASSTPTNIEKLLAGRGRFFFYRQPGLSLEAKKSGNETRLRILPTIFDSQSFYMVLGPHIDKEVESRVAHALEKLNEQGELKQLADKWAAY
jgi:ABC-type amino acid transport substrate-binding protein